MVKDTYAKFSTTMLNVLEDSKSHSTCSVLLYLVNQGEVHQIGCNSHMDLMYNAIAKK